MVFRYPGGKSRLAKKILQHLNFDGKRDYYEPFVGGGSILISVAKQNLDTKLHVNDLDDKIYSFWKLFELNEDSKFDVLFDLLNNKPTVELFQKLRSIEPKDIVENAYYAIFFNRTTFSGIYRSGPIGGYGQKSKYRIDCRYNYEKMVKEIKELRILFKDRIFVHCLDFKDFLTNVPNGGLIYLDPPYYWEGKGLYNKYMLPEQHFVLSDLLKKRINWVLSYDKCQEIKRIYEAFSVLDDLKCKYTVDVIKKDKREDSKEYLIIPKNNLTFSKSHDTLDKSLNNKGEINMSNTNETNTNTVTKRGRGRPKGSKNKPKTAAVPAAAVPAAAASSASTSASTASNSGV